MTHELTLKVYKVKACLLRLKCGVSSKYKTQVLLSLDRISFLFLYVIGSFRLQVVSPTLRSIRLHDQSRFAYTVAIEDR